jgi:hypothetical protein
MCKNKRGEPDFQKGPMGWKGAITEAAYIGIHSTAPQ